MDELKKVLLAGIGLTAMTYDKAEKFVKELMDKGRLTLDEGKELQSELKRKSQEEAKDLLGQIKEKSQSLQYATKEDLQRLEGKLDALLEELKQSKSDE
jgi:polyhydroxyalkanoate synthesis regulator phasin